MLGLTGHKLTQKRTGETREAVEKAVKEASSWCCKQAAMRGNPLDPRLEEWKDFLEAGTEEMPKEPEE